MARSVSGSPRRSPPGSTTTCADAYRRLNDPCVGIGRPIREDGRMPYDDALDHRPAHPEALRGLGDAFRKAGYTVAAVRELLGPVAGAALARDEIVPALRATTGGSPLETLVRLFWLQVPVPDMMAAGLADDLLAAGLAEHSGGELRALVHIEPVEPIRPGVTHYVVSDLKVRPGSGLMLRPD